RAVPRPRSGKTHETATIAPNPHSTRATSPPVISASPLPATDGDLEVIGDHIAEAVVHLNQGRREAALRALDQAQAVTRRAMTRRPITDRARERLKPSLREMEQAPPIIRVGKLGTAAVALRKLDRQLDASAF